MSKLTPDQMKACLEAKRLGKKKPNNLPKSDEIVYESTINNPALAEQYWQQRRDRRLQHHKEKKKDLIKRIKHIQHNPSNLPEPQLKKMLAQYNQNKRDIEIQIKRSQDGMKVAEQLFLKNQHREEHKIREKQDTLEKVIVYISIMEDALKPAKKTLPKPKPKPKPPEEPKKIIEEKPPIIEEEEYPCPICNKIYASEPSLKRHITMNHKEE
jgi:hypothetical protein